MQHTDLPAQGDAVHGGFSGSLEVAGRGTSCCFPSGQSSPVPPVPPLVRKRQACLISVPSLSVCHCGQRQDSERKPQVVRAAESQKTAEWAPGAAGLLSEEPGALLSVPLLGKHPLLHVCWDMPPSSAPSPLLLPPPSRVETDLFCLLVVPSY